MRKISMPLAALLAVFLSTSALRAEESAGTVTKESGDSDTNWIVKSSEHHTRPMQLSVAVGFPLYWGFGAMAWYTLPIVHDGFIPKVNDSFDLEFGLMFGVHPFGGYGYGYGLGAGGVDMSLTPLVGVRWNFFLTKDWTVFASVKLGATIWLYNGGAFGYFNGGGILGAQYRVTDNMSLRMETGWPYTSFGLAWDL